MTDAEEARSGPSSRATGRVLRKRIEAFFSPPNWRAHRLPGCWEKWTGTEFTDVCILRLAEEDDPDDGLWKVADVVREMRFPRPSQLTSADERARDLLLAVILSLSDRLITLYAPSPSLQGQAVDVPMANLLTAAVMAGAWLDVPPDIRYEPNPGGLRPRNVIEDFAPLEVDTAEGSALGVMRQELEAMLAREFAWAQAGRGGSDRNLLMGLRHLRAVHGFVPMVAVPQGEHRHPLADQARREAFADRFKVPVIRYGDSAAPTQIRELEEDLLKHLRGSLGNLFQTDREEKAVVARPKVFISYAHEDEPWRELLRESLRSLERKKLLEIWDDRQLRTGDLWRREIDKALSSCGIAVLLVSRPFLNSDFINDVELVKIFDRHEREGLKIYPILIGQCDWKGEEWLAERQMKLCCGQPFRKASEADRDDGLAEIAKEFRERLDPPKP